MLAKSLFSVTSSSSLCYLVCVDVLAGVKSMLDKIGNEITAFSKMFPVESSLANFTIFLNDRHKYIESFYPQIDQMDFYRFGNLAPTVCLNGLALCTALCIL